MPKTATIPQPVAASPEREHLADVIARKQAITERLARINSALEVTFVFDSMEKVEKAQQSLAEAHKVEPRRLIAGILGDQALSGLSIEQAQFALDDAREDLKRAIATRDALEVQRTETERDLRWAESAVRAAVTKVVEAEGSATKLLGEYREAQAEVARLHELLTILDSWNCLPDKWDNLHYMGPTHVEHPWRAALSALEKDANAPLPG